MIVFVALSFTKSIRSIVDYRGKTPEKQDEGTLLVTARNKMRSAEELSNIFGIDQEKIDLYEKCPDTAYCYAWHRAIFC